MTALCEDIEINVVREDWVNCWSSEDGGKLGKKVADGSLDGCMTYTHSQEVRDKYADFTDAILDDNKAAGLLTLLDEDGNPKVTGLDDLSGLNIIDVGGEYSKLDHQLFFPSLLISNLHTYFYPFKVGHLQQMA